MGMEAAQRESTLRFSFSEENTFEEVDYVLEVIGQVLPMLQIDIPDTEAARKRRMKRSAGESPAAA